MKKILIIQNNKKLEKERIKNEKLREIRLVKKLYFFLQYVNSKK
jgi:hypothetical protein